jgi:hypothetical protein
MPKPEESFTILSKIQNIGRYAQSHTLFFTISSWTNSNALSYQLQKSANTLYPNWSSWWYYSTLYYSR